MVKQPPLIDGTCKPGFEGVMESFRRNFAEGWERGGASFAVFHNGKLVVDIWGGFADRKCRRPWREDTLSTIFSCTKSLAAICMSILVDRGMCDYSDKVTKYWPEFGQNGKEDITIEMILSHKAGLPYLSKRLELADLTDPSRMSAILEAETPQFPPGTKTAYQALVFGWLVDQLFRRLDADHRGMGQFFREEVAEKHHIDIHVGDCAQEEWRIVRLTDMEHTMTVRECAYDRQIIKIGAYFYNPKGNFTRALRNMRNFGTTFSLHNNPDTRIVGQPAVNGIATAKALAEVHQLMMEGTLTGRSVLQKLQAPVFVDEFDHTIGERQSKGHGFMYTKSPTGSWQVGHSGVGGQIVKMDSENEIVIAYLTNSMKAGAGEHVFTCNRLTRKVYDCVEALKKNQDAKTD